MFQKKTASITLGNSHRYLVYPHDVHTRDREINVFEIRVTEELLR